MNRFRSVPALCFVALCSGQVCLSADSTATASESYSPGVLIQGAWGSGAKEFGLDNPADHTDGNWPFIAPNALAVDNSGNVYILDPVNKRIKVYDRQGSYSSSVPLDSLRKDFEYFGPWANKLAVGSDGQVFLLTPMIPHNVRVVLEVSRRGHISRAFMPKSDLDGIKHGKRSKMAEETVAGFERRNAIEAVPEGSGEVEDLFTDWSGTVYLRTRNSAYLNLGNAADFSQYRGSLSKDKKYVYVRNPAITDRRRVAPISSISVFDADYRTRRDLSFALPHEWQAKGWQVHSATVANEDKAGNKYVYIVAALKTGDKTLYSRDTTDLVFRYAPNWRMVGVIEIPVVDRIYSIPLAYGNEGSVYQLVWNSDDVAAGVRVLKWALEKGSAR